MKKRLLVILFLQLLTVYMTSCSRTALLDFTASRDNEQYREMVDKVFIALDSENKEELKKLFAESVIKTDSDIDSQINALFEYYKGPKESDEGVGATHTKEHVEYGKKKIELNGWFTVQASGVKHNVYLFILNGLLIYIKNNFRAKNLLMCSQIDSSNISLYIIKVENVTRKLQLTYYVTYRLLYSLEVKL